MVYKVKVAAYCTVERYKPSLVAQIFTQTCGTDYGEIFLPVIRVETLYTTLVISAQKD